MFKAWKAYLTNGTHVWPIFLDLKFGPGVNWLSFPIFILVSKDMAPSFVKRMCPYSTVCAEEWLKDHHAVTECCRSQAKKNCQGSVN